MKRVYAFVIALAVLGMVLTPVKAQASFYEVPQPRDRVIEVVDRIGPKRWNVKAAVRWLDRYTASDMRIVKRCSGKAYRCVTLKIGKVTGPVGWSRGNTVTVDDRKAMGKYGKWYRKSVNRKWLLVHELGHQFGLEHSSGKNVMNAAVNRYAMKLSSKQKAMLRKR